MKEKINILIYEKNLKLNQILKEQITKLNIDNIYKITNENEFQKKLESIEVKILIINLNDLNQNTKNIIENNKINNNIKNILVYYDKKHSYLSLNINEIIVLEKPFKIIYILNEIKKLFFSKVIEDTCILLTEHLKFLPFEKVLINIKTKNKQHLTEKENKLLLHLYTNKNTEITKDDLLNMIWGITESINTHTIETHIYRLKQKLYKVEPMLSFLISNNNGLYSMQFKNDL